MSKYKIEVELDIDFQKFFDGIPDGLFDEKVYDESYELESIHDALSKSYSNVLMNNMSLMLKPSYEYSRHHMLIQQEIFKQLSTKSKVTKI